MHHNSQDKPGLHWEQTGERRWKSTRGGRTYIIEQQTNALFIAFDPCWPARATDPLLTFQEAMLAAQDMADEWDAQLQGDECV